MENHPQAFDVCVRELFQQIGEYEQWQSNETEKDSN
jgi:hypothetical protein